jgi:hypothetical protein
MMISVIFHGSPKVLYWPVSDKHVAFADIRDDVLATGINAYICASTPRHRVVYLASIERAIASSAAIESIPPRPDAVSAPSRNIILSCWFDPQTCVPNAKASRPSSVGNPADMWAVSGY